MLDIKRLLFETNKTQAELGEIVGLPQSAISNMMKGFRQIRPEHIRRWKEVLGDQLVDSCIIPDEAFDAHAGAKTVQATIISADTVEEIKEDLRNEVAEELKDTAVIAEPVIVPTSIMQRPDTDSKKWVESREAQTNADRLQIASILNATDMAWRVEDEAMRPTLFQGEYVLLKEMDDEAQIIDGRVYAIDTKFHGNLIRRVYDEGDSYRLAPLNKDGFAAITIRKEDGYNRRYRILCHLSTEITILPDVDEERRRQDRLIDEVSKAGGRVDRLIDLLEKKN